VLDPFRVFFTFSEQVKRQHIEEEVAEICMYQSTSEKAIPLLAPGDVRRIKYEIIDDPVVAETCNGDQGGDDYYY